MRGRLHTKDDIITYMLGGRGAPFTIVGKEKRFTYEIRLAKKSKRFWASVLTQPDSYEFIGEVKLSGFIHSTKSRIKAQAPSIVAIKWLCNLLNSTKDLPETFEFWHEGRCCKCNRQLTVPESIASGIGPICAGKE